MKETSMEVKCDIALPCATQNELTGDDAEKLVKNDVSVFVKVQICHVHLKQLRSSRKKDFFLLRESR